MSERTVERRLARVRASEMADRRRESEERCSERISRWRLRFDCRSVEDVGGLLGSESRRRVI